jgi:hypothetical protein
MMRTIDTIVRLTLAAGVALAAGSVAIRAQQPPPANQLPLEPQRNSGDSITPAYEGWYQNPDGSFTMLLGYYNRNRQQTFDIPVGPHNMIEPGTADQGQPTHFETGRQWGVFTVKLPKDFGNKTVTWTIVSNGERQSIPFTLHKAYPITPFKELGMGNMPPTLWFTEGGPKFSGPPTVVAASLTGAVNQPVSINVWADDVKAAGEGEGGGRGSVPNVATLSFHKFRGPGKIAFDPLRIFVKKAGEMVSTKATFSAPGDYLVRVQANDESGEGGLGFQCCWTNTYVQVAVR